MVSLLRQLQCCTRAAGGYGFPELILPGYCYETYETQRHAHYAHNQPENPGAVRANPVFNAIVQRPKRWPNYSASNNESRGKGCYNPEYWFHFHLHGPSLYGSPARYCRSSD